MLLVVVQRLERQLDNVKIGGRWFVSHHRVQGFSLSFYPLRNMSLKGSSRR